MKKLLFRYLLGMLPVIALFSNANAQFKLSSDLINGFSNRDVDFTSANIGAASGYISNAVDISSKALKNFNKNFKKAKFNFGFSCFRRLKS
jgi:hypothetical protein